MLNFDPERFLRIQRGAVALAGDLIDCVRRQAETKGIETVHFLGAGGANILMLPAVQLLQNESTVTSYAPHPAELVEVGSRRIGEQTLVVAPSLSGTTRETVDALEYCRDRGATTIALTGHADTPVAKAAEHVFVNFAEDDTSSESFYVQSLVIALSRPDRQRAREASGGAARGQGARRAARGRPGPCACTRPLSHRVGCR
jgi:fructoselysine-6-phosphate deglycase